MSDFTVFDRVMTRIARICDDSIYPIVLEEFTGIFKHTFEKLQVHYMDKGFNYPVDDLYFNMIENIDHAVDRTGIRDPETNQLFGEIFDLLAEDAKSGLHPELSESLWPECVSFDDSICCRILNLVKSTGLIKNYDYAQTICNVVQSLRTYFSYGGTTRSIERIRYIMRNSLLHKIPMRRINKILTILITETAKGLPDLIRTPDEENLIDLTDGILFACAFYEFEITVLTPSSLELDTDDTSLVRRHFRSVFELLRKGADRESCQNKITDMLRADTWCTDSSFNYLFYIGFDILAEKASIKRLPDRRVDSECEPVDISSIVQNPVPDTNRCV
jgi:hypothetical protein